MCKNVRDDFLVARADLDRTEWASVERPDRLPPGHVELRVTRFAFTSNNVTYAKFGEAIEYWRHFPAATPGYGRIPVWGIGEVVRSECDEIATGERIYGYLPMSSHAALRPAAVGGARFLDAAEHRESLPRTYNEYRRLDHDRSYDPTRADAHLVLRPLFSLSFFLAEFLKEAKLFGAARVIVTSASSKTAIGLAHLLRAVPGLEIVGLTSPRNIGFVQHQSSYDAAVAYDAICDLPRATASVIVDIAGSNAILLALHRHLAGAVRHSSRVGATHAQDGERDAELPGPKPEFFFTPTHIVERRKTWGEAELSRRIAAAWDDFLDAVPTWLRIEHSIGRGAVERVYREVSSGAAPPDRADVLTVA